MKTESTLKATNLSNVIYHNLQLARQSINELNYLLNHLFDFALFPFVGYPNNFFTNLIDIHGRNAVIMLFSLLDGETSIKKMIDYYQSNFDDIEFKNTMMSRTEIAELIKTSRDRFDVLYNKYFPLLKANRNKIAAHQDSINANNVLSIGDYVFPLSDMLDLLPELKKLFAALYYSLAYEEYVIYPEKSFINEGLHALYESKINDLDNN